MFSAALILVSPAIDASQALADKNGCSWCHDLNRTSVGPSVRQIAQRYASQPEAGAMLSEKVLKGGGGPWHGTWGQVPMPPNPDLKADTMRQIVDWMLQQR
jgi:cytochrome c